jgi:predicted GNAT family N-acyltransferase
MMICELVPFNSPNVLQVYQLRQDVLRKPLGLNLFDEDLLSEYQELFFVGSENHQIVSCLQLKKLENGVLKLRQMATDTKYQGKGFGKELVQFAERWSVENGYSSVELHARKVAQLFYEKLGYEKAGEEFLEVDIAHFKMTKSLV